MDNRNNYCPHSIFWDYVTNNYLKVLMLINTAHHHDYLSNTSTLVADMQDKILYLCTTAAMPSHKCKTEPEPTQRCCAVFVCICMCNCLHASASLCWFSCVYICFFCCSETFSFMLTGEDGSRRFGYCRRLLVSHCSAPHPLLPVHTLLSPVCCDRPFYVSMW